MRYLDLPRFEVINDACGHTLVMGCLQPANVLKEHIRDQDPLAQLGGAEVAVILNRRHLNNALDIANSCGRQS